jgi:hypothetical protein
LQEGLSICAQLHVHVLRMNVIVPASEDRVKVS